MKFYIDEQNTIADYCYATFEESLGGRPLFVDGKAPLLIIPVINQGIYGLKTFNFGSDVPLYYNRSYYLFRGISEYTESVSIRNGSLFRGEFSTNFKLQSLAGDLKEYYVELETGYNGSFTYGATWKVKAHTFGVLIPDNALHSEAESTFYKRVEKLNNEDIDFLLNQQQNELAQFILFL